MSGVVVQFRPRSSVRQMTKRERVEFLLDHYEDFFLGTSAQASVAAGDEGNVPLLPLMSRHPSVRELLRCLLLLQAHAPSQFQHVKAFYTAEWRTRDVVVKARKGKPLGPRRVRERVVPSWVRAQKVRLGVDFVASQFRGEVFIPNELMEAAA